MKRSSILFTVYLFAIFTCLSGFTTTNSPSLRITANEEFSGDWTAWSIWYTGNCFSGISYRYRERTTSIAEKNQVQVEIKNNYKKGISISHRVTTDPNANAIYRFDLKPGESHVTEEYVLKNKKMYVLMDKLRFAGDSYGDSYRPCDQ
ncbi:hypothetical protein [Flavobacterium sp.]|uniref:hypothetical protein n=1 Tax=Flavobacterium sp. TaxID=239 RepID=UPI003A92DE77